MFILTVTCQHRDFYAYWYGTGTIISVSEEGDRHSYDGKQCTFKVNYEDDEYRANYQADRFASGLIFAKVEEYRPVVTTGLWNDIGQ